MINPEQAKKLIIEVLQSEFKNSKKDLVDVANKIFDKVISLNENLNRFNVKEASKQIRPDHKQVGYAVMTEQISSKGDDEAKKSWEKSKKNQGL